ncbi:P-type conjugative transfer protein TrbJ [Altericroceibacterium endophyticum]|uniref:P-type conjugative transfer protein TrbJ n=1 Tax=Altericroceibacterium endophyticum TaxID=1808508 RepID=A0A6I4T4L6_9SPHN|nr:P-type conjugative transfer protein TrbJ [Altericroceibacterium endophyticum]MXO65319.1 P-type conjugative transfer protein TrbJ [Altericroceibacterium endophyticum]
MKSPLLRRALMAGVLATASVFGLAATTPAHAQFGGIVYDPSNYAQNVLTAARTLEQINNQVQSLQNEAQSLLNEARNLTALPLSQLQEVQTQFQRTQQLLGQAQRLAYDVHQIDQTFAQSYRGTNLSGSDRQLVADAQGRWRTSVAAFEDALKVQAGVVGNIDGSRASLERLVTASQSATGALQAAQAGNQLVALQSQQLADVTALMAAQGRAQALDMAERAAAKAQAREQLRRFLTPRTGYQPGNARMFRD